MRIPWESKWSNTRESRGSSTRGNCRKNRYLLAPWSFLGQPIFFLFFFIIIKQEYYLTSWFDYYCFERCWEILVNLYEFTSSLLQVVHFIGAVCLQFWIGAASFRRNEELKNVSECSITGLLGYGILEHECTCSYGNRMAQRPISNSLFPFSRSLSILSIHLSGDFKG